MASSRLLAATASLDLPMNPLRVAFDVGPLAGPRTGVGNAVAAMHDSLAAASDIELVDYIVSFRSRPAAGTSRLPVPALVAHRLWAMADRPRVDRFLDKPDIVHGTNYVVPPCAFRRWYPCTTAGSFGIRHSSGTVHRAGRVLRRATSAATVHASSASTAAEVTDLFPAARAGRFPWRPCRSHRHHRNRRYRDRQAVHRRDRHAGTPQNLPLLVEAFGLRRANTTTSCWCSRVPTRRSPATINGAIDALDPAAARRVVMTGRVDESARSWLLRNAAVLAYPSPRRGVRLSSARCDASRRADRASNRGSIPECAAQRACRAD